jgi:DNA-binding NarL/FixJ family response regulator
MDRCKVMIVASDGTAPETDTPLPTGADGYISQPFSNEELVDKVTQLLEPSYV